mgnify:CR=1 FL=1
MTGTIKSLDIESSSGVITAADGTIVGFRQSEVLAYDVPILAAGQVVSFDLEPGRHPKALNVVVQRAPQSGNAKDKRLEIARLRYVGFEHRGNTRAYFFEYVVPGVEKRTFTVHADLTLFVKHHVGMQEGPALCLRLLTADPDIAEARPPESLDLSLTDQEMQAYVANRPLPRAKHGPKRTTPTAGPALHIR